MLCQIQKAPAYRRYVQRMGLATVCYVGSIMLASRLIPHGGAPLDAVTVTLALLPGLAAIGMITAIARLLIELDDEYLRMLEVRKALIATGLTLAGCSVWGLLEIYTAVPRLPVFWVFPLWAMGLAVGEIWNKVRGA